MGIQKLVSVLQYLVPESVTPKTIDSLKHARLAIDAHIYMYEAMALQPHYHGQHVIGMLRMAQWLQRRQISPIFVFDNQSQRLESKRGLLSMRRERKRQFIDASVHLSATVDTVTKLKECFRCVRTLIAFVRPLLCAGNSRDADIEALHLFFEDCVHVFLPNQVISHFFLSSVEPSVSFLQPTDEGGGFFLSNLFMNCKMAPNLHRQWIEINLDSLLWSDASVTRFLAHLCAVLLDKLHQIADKDPFVTCAEEDTTGIDDYNDESHEECGLNFTYLALCCSQLSLIACEENKNIIKKMWQAVYRFRKQFLSAHSSPPDEHASDASSHRCSILKHQILLPVLIYRSAAVLRSGQVVAPTYSVVCEFDTQMHLQCLLCTETEIIKDEKEPGDLIETKKTGSTRALVDMALSPDSLITKSASASTAASESNSRNCSEIESVHFDLLLFKEKDESASKRSSLAHNSNSLWHTMQKMCNSTNATVEKEHSLLTAIAAQIDAQIATSGVANLDYAAHQFACSASDQKHNYWAEENLKTPVLGRRGGCIEKRVDHHFESLAHLKTPDIILAHLAEMQKSVLKQTVRVGFEEANQVKAALLAYGVVVVDAEHEAEAMCVQLCLAGHADYVVTDDSDAIPFGATRILRNFSTRDTAAPSEICGEQIDCDVLKQKLNLSHLQLVDWCVLCGCDFLKFSKKLRPLHYCHQNNQNSTAEEILRVLQSEKAALYYSSGRRADFIASEFNFSADDMTSLLSVTNFFYQNQTPLSNEYISSAQKLPVDSGSKAERAEALKTLLKRLDCMQHAAPYLSASENNVDELTRSASLSPL